VNVRQVKSEIEKEVSRLIAHDFKKAADDIMVGFYGGYYPEYYPRTYDLKRSVVYVCGYSYGGVNVNIENNYKAYTMWENGIRGLPPGYKGFVEYFNVSIPEFGITASSPHEAMSRLENEWEKVRQKEVTDIVDSFLEKLDIFF